MSWKPLSNQLCANLSQAASVGTWGSTSVSGHLRLRSVHNVGNEESGNHPSEVSAGTLFFFLIYGFYFHFCFDEVLDTIQ